MLLIDALYICTGGGLRLLNYLLDSLEKNSIDYHLICDERCSHVFMDIKGKTVLKPSLFSRNNFYKRNRSSFSSVFCFGNIPPSIKLNVPVYTYFHNINLLTLNQTKGLMDFFKSWLKREIYRKYRKNTDFWLVQTENTATVLSLRLYEVRSKIRLYPFYYLPKELILLKKVMHGGDYVFVGDYYNGAKGHDDLLDSWEILFNRGYNLRLHLTIDKSNEKVCKRIEEMNERGINVVNHGTIPFDKVVDLYAKSKALVYPSHNESLGLGIVEAITAGCDVLASDLPFTHSICVPSRVFNPYSPDSIADAIIKYEEGEYSKSELIVRNQIDELIGLLVKNEKNINS